MVIPVLIAFYHGFREEIGSILAVPVTFAIVGIAFLTLGFMVDTGSMIYYFGPVVSSASSADAGSITEIVQLVQDSIEVTWAVGSFLGYGGSILWIAILIAKTKRVSKWLNLVGIIAGAAGFVWLIRFIPIPAPQSAGTILIFVNIVFGMVWLVAISVNLVRSKETA